MPKTLIYDPKNNPGSPINSIAIPIEAMSSPIRFPRIINRNTNKKVSNLETVETKGVWIYPGTNLNVPDDDFEYISKHHLGLEYFSNGSIKIIEPTIEEGKQPTETTKDYSEKNAIELIKYSFDTEWLEKSEKKEERPLILKLIAERIKALNVFKEK